ncbi:MAG: hypothetical protein HY562_06275 [Ignavibacteriales bacterium]|nr:hypothetical protein [Ignavibacteriales bacterium]
MARAFSHPGWGLVRDSKGNIYFVDVGRNVVWKADTMGTVSRFVSRKHSHELFVDERDNIYGVHVEYDSKTEKWLNQRWKATPAGNVSGLDSHTYRHLFELIDVHKNTFVFSSDAHKNVARVLRVSADGDTIHFAGGGWGDRDGKGLTAQFRNFGPSVWTADSALIFGAGGILRKLSLDGTVSTLAGEEHGFGDPEGPRASGILGVTVSYDGSMYAASWEKKVVIRVDKNGNVSRFYESSTGWAPVGVLALPDAVFILEDRVGIGELLRMTGFGGPRVRKISPDGLTTLVGTAK